MTINTVDEALKSVSTDSDFASLYAAVHIMLEISGEAKRRITSAMKTYYAAEKRQGETLYESMAKLLAIGVAAGILYEQRENSQ